MTISPLEIVLIILGGIATITYVIYCIIQMVKKRKQGKNENKGSNTKTD